MAKVITRPPAGDLYEDDFALWAERQAAILRARRFDELDLANLIEEVEDLSRRERDMVESRLETILEHLLKLELSRASRPRRGWFYAGLKRPVTRQLGKDGVSSDAMPAACPYTLDQILDPDWYPDNPQKLAKP